MSTATLPRLFSERQLCAMFGVSRVTLWHWRTRASNPFPAPVRVGPNTNRWTEDAIIQFLEQRLKVAP